MKRMMLTGLIILFCFTAKGQFIDNYGLKIGGGISNQYWNFKFEGFSDLSGWKYNKGGFIGQVYAEKNINKFLSFRPAIGYIRKGFIDEDISLLTSGFNEFSVLDRDVVFNNLSLDLALKIIPLDKIVKPYIILGLRGDYLLDYRSVIIESQGEEYELSTKLLDEFNKFTLGAIFGAGVSYKDLLFLDLEFNPAITKNYESDFMIVNDKFFGMTLGVNINRIIKDKKE